MLKGKDFGVALGKAIDLKLQNGSVKSKAEIARHFQMKPPSLSDWVKKGAVSKDKLPELWRYFSDVADHVHWGMTRSEWPFGLTENTAQATIIQAREPDAPTINPFRDGAAASLLSIFAQLSPDRKQAVITFAEERLALQLMDHQRPAKRAGQ